MANTRNGTVIRVDTSAQYDGQFEIAALKFVPTGASPTASIKADSTSGNKVWETALSTEMQENGFEIYLSTGMYVTVSNAVLYIYLCDD
jgi:hypothetical protein